MKNKNNVLIVIGVILVLSGALLPSIRIAQENISFIKENGLLIIILTAAMFLLFKMNYKQLLYIPSILSIMVIVKFIIDNNDRIKQINKVYNCYASFKYGLAVMILGNLLILTIITIELLEPKKLGKIKKIITEKADKLKEKILEKKYKTTKETTKDGKIEFKKITVKCEKPIKKMHNKTINTIKTKRITKHNLSISKYKENKDQAYKTYNIPVIDIQKWTQSDICCSNCGATVHTTSEYCFLCDCKIKLKQEKQKLS